MKKCPKCGQQWENSKKFCGNCGMKLGEIIEEKDVILQKPDESIVSPEREDESVVRPERAEQKIVLPEKKKSGNKIWKVVFGASFIAILALAIRLLLPSFLNTDKLYVALEKGKFQLFYDIKNNKALELNGGSTEFGNSEMLKYSQDRKYIYYIENYDYKEGTGDLYRCEYQKIRNRSDKNDKYRKFIASDVFLTYSPMEDGKVVYLCEDNILYYFNGKESVELKKDVNQFYCTEDEKRIAYECGDYEEGALYIAELDNPDKRTAIASGYTGVYPISSYDNIYFYKKNLETSEKDVYSSGIKKSPKKLGTLVTGMEYPSDDTVYYTGEDTGYDFSELITDSRGNTEELQNILEEFEDEEVKESLYSNKKGKEKLISSNVPYSVYAGNALVYISLDDYGAIDIANLSEEDFEEEFENAFEKEMYKAGIHIISADTKAEVLVTEKATRDLVNALNQADQPRIYINDTDIIVSDDDKVMAAAIHNGEVKAFKTIKENGYARGADDSVLYYIGDERHEDEDTYCNVYSYHNGKSKCIAENIIYNLIDIYEDGKMYVYTERNEDGGYTLEEIDKKGNKHPVGDNVITYIRCNEKLLFYIDDNEKWMGKSLYYYKNGENHYITTGIDWAWSPQVMEPTIRLGIDNTDN